MSASGNTRPKIMPHRTNEKLIFFNSDHCPLGQRGWITLFEKKVDFQYVEVNTFNKGLETTKLLLEVSPQGRVPAAIHYGKNIYDSVPFCKYIDEMFPENSLFPSTPYSRWRANEVLQTISEDFGPTFFKVLCENNFERWKEHRDTMRDILERLNEQISYCGGPWFMGEQFTLVDIALMPFFERMVALFPYYRNWDPFEDFPKLKKWMETAFARESFKLTSLLRGEQSMRIQPFRHSNRVDYLREANHAFVLNKIPEMQKLLAHSFGPDSAISFVKDKTREIKERSKKSPQNSTVMAV